MSKQIVKILLCFLFVLITTAPAFAQQKMDPILLDEPNDAIFNCKNDIFFEVSTQAAIGKQFAGRTAEDQYLYMTVKILYLAERSMKGLDRKSFSLIHINNDESQTEYPLNFALSMMSNRIKGNINFSEKTLKMPAYWTLDLVFNIDSTDKENWTLVFNPVDRGGKDSYCQINVPLYIK